MKSLLWDRRSHFRDGHMIQKIENGGSTPLLCMLTPLIFKMVRWISPIVVIRIKVRSIQCFVHNCCQRSCSSPAILSENLAQGKCKFCLWELVWIFHIMRLVIKLQTYNSGDEQNGKTLVLLPHFGRICMRAYGAHNICFTTFTQLQHFKTNSFHSCQYH